MTRKLLTFSLICISCYAYTKAIASGAESFKKMPEIFDPMDSWNKLDKLAKPTQASVADN